MSGRLILILVVGVLAAAPAATATSNAPTPGGGGGPTKMMQQLDPTLYYVHMQRARFKRHRPPLRLAWLLEQAASQKARHIVNTGRCYISGCWRGIPFGLWITPWYPPYWPRNQYHEARWRKCPAAAISPRKTIRRMLNRKKSRFALLHPFLREVGVAVYKFRSTRAVYGHGRTRCKIVVAEFYMGWH